MKHIPLFIKRLGDGYKYYGTYREPRYSDRLGANEMLELPQYVKEHWARKMGAKREPRCAMEAIREAWPKTSIGWFDSEKMVYIDFDEDLEESLGTPLKNPISVLEAEVVTTKDILEAFEQVGLPP